MSFISSSVLDILSRLVPTQVVLVTTRASVCNSSCDDGANAVVALTSAGVGDLNLAAAVGARRLVFLPVVRESDDLATVLSREIDL